MIASSLLLAAACVVANSNAMPKLDFDPYEALGVPRQATKSDIRRAFRKLSLEFHPDKSNKGEAGRARFTQISLAYEVLGDADKRSIYDEFGVEQYHSRWEYMQSNGAKPSGGDFYGPESNVKTVDVRNFTQPRDTPMLVEFYAPWCVHCQNMVGEYRRAALLLEGTATVGAVNCERQQMICRNTNIRSYPSLYLYPKGSPHQSPEAFHGQHTADAIADFVEQVVHPATVALTTTSFKREVMRSKDVWVIMFSTPWCGPCKDASPFLRDLAFELKGRVRVGTVNCEETAALCQQMNVRYYPHITLFGKGDKDSMNDGHGYPLDYNINQPAASTAIKLLHQVLEALVEAPEHQSDGLEYDDDDDMDDFYRELDDEL